MGRLIASKMDGDFDVVNVHDFAYKVAPFYKKRNPSARIIWTENDPPYMYLPKRSFAYDRLSYVFNIIKDIRERRYYRSIDRVAVLDGYNETWARTRGLAPVIVRSGVDFDNFYHPAHIRSEARAPFVLFSLGALNPYRRFEDLIEATALLRARGLQATARIICKDIWGEGAYRKLLEEQVARLGAQTYVSLNFDGASNAELKEAFNTSDAFVLTTHLPPPRNGYGWGLTNFEAMAAGLPLVICRTSTATEVLTDQKHAVIVEPRNPIDLADRIASLMSDPAHYNQIASAGQSYVRDNISWQKYASDMLELIQA
jgi:glycosyltransferase involved in cell wall biosynthesis